LAHTNSAIFNLIECIEEFRKIDPEMPIQRIEVFLTVARSEGITYYEVSERVDLALSSVNRNIRDLGDMNRKGQRGYGLIETRPDPVQTKRKACWLTPKGRRVVRSLASSLGDARL
jgi:DNA-binding MarR family transcriptional regulator